MCATFGHVLAGSLKCQVGISNQNQQHTSGGCDPWKTTVHIISYTSPQPIMKRKETRKQQLVDQTWETCRNGRGYLNGVPFVGVPFIERGAAILKAKARPDPWFPERRNQGQLSARSVGQVTYSAAMRNSVGPMVAIPTTTHVGVP